MMRIERRVVASNGGALLASVAGRGPLQVLSVLPHEAAANIERLRDRVPRDIVFRDLRPELVPCAASESRQVSLGLRRS